MATDADFNRLLRVVEQLVIQFREHLGLDVGDEDEGYVWQQAFLAEHPELRGHFIKAGTYHDGTPRPAYYQYESNDVPEDRILEALAKLSETHPAGVTTRDVMGALFGSPDEAAVRVEGGLNFYLSTVPQQIGNRLWSLTVRGVVDRTRKRQGSTPALWRLARAAR